MPKISSQRFNGQCLNNMKKIQKLLCLFTILLCLVNVSVEAQINFSKSNNLEAMKEAAAFENKPFIVYFTMDICPPCERMKKEVFAKNEVANIVDQKYLAYSVNLNQHYGKNLGQQQNVQSAPTFLFFDASGNLTQRVDGATSLSNFVKILDANSRIEVPHTDFSDFR